MFVIRIVCALLICSIFMACNQSTEQEPTPNVVIFFLDDSGWSDFSPFGEEHHVTPNVQKLADEGCTFTNFYVPQAICSASRAALMTGCYPGRTKVFGAHGPGEVGLDPSYTTMGEIFQKGGYKTGVFGKWHIGDTPATRPANRGFDESAGLMYSNDMWEHHATAPKYWGQWPLQYWKNNEVVIDKITPEHQEQLTQMATKESLSFIKKHKDQPFFLYVPYSMPHVPLYCSNEFKGKSGKGLYGDVLMEIDWSVGKILTQIKENGLEDNTIVVFSSDNGPWAVYGEHAGFTPFREAKATSFDGGVKSACIIKYPGQIKQGGTNAGLFCSIDLLPSLSAITGVGLPPDLIDGKDVSPLILGDSSFKNPHKYYAISRGNNLESIISSDGKWKLHLPHKYHTVIEGGKDGMAGKQENKEIALSLFKLVDDPTESENVINEYPEIAEELKGFGEIHYSNFFSNKEEKALDLVENLSLKGYDDEHEEYPSLVTDGNGQMWTFALRRISYPENTELISAYHFDGKKWQDVDPITTSTDKYEVPVAACAKNGKPIVAWAEIKGQDWIINASRMTTDGFSTPHAFPVSSGRSINPELLALEGSRNWIAWENLHNGIFKIYISKFENGQWSEPVIIDKGNNSCFDPSMAQAKNGDLYVAYGLTNGFHQDIEMTILDGESLQVKKVVPVAIGGGHKNRVNINSRPALAFDAWDNLWISYENNRNASRFEDGDNYTGDRCCAILSYQNGKIVEVQNKDKWLFSGVNDHIPTFFKDNNGNLFLATHCGGDFSNNGWKYRLSWLDPGKGWQEPVTLFDTKVKGLMNAPALAFDGKGDLWLATINEKTIKNNPNEHSCDIQHARLTELNVMRFVAPNLSGKYNTVSFTKTTVEEFTPDEKSIGTYSGHPRVERRKMTINGEAYTLLYGNLHEHSNSSNCWPAGTDGTLHDDYRFGMYSEAYDFFGMTDHDASTSEIYWRRNLRMADFYNESDNFVAIPAIEWALQSDRALDDIQHGAGHYNIIFASTTDAQKYTRNKHELYSAFTPESSPSPRLWAMLDKNDIECVTIPHHVADEVHPLDWNVYNPKYVPIVDIFQCRGNHEYRGCPRENNVSRHTTTKYDRAFVDYALRDKKYKMGFIASGDHNNMGVGLAGLWVKEVSRKGIIEALRSRRTFATTGDKIFIDLKMNETIMGETCNIDQEPKLTIEVVGQYPLEKVEILRNSKVIHVFDIEDGGAAFKGVYTDKDYKDEKEVLYYYIRATQKNNELAWSSPIWVEKK
ncbi:sulfatase-like hydrolase/transferase [Carboxylicivirga marina]|uniref:sulfatase-like hydrolase/transferase n=1 Tax=Carboxylicivirga marina TaxID=2800988 RepID=UPI002591CD65|nr:sulfatase-like hydrolase/transferase [uncultured Carboxylicivirga sp.]